MRDTLPVHHPTSLRFEDLVLGDYKRCAVTSSGEVYCWGNSYFGVTLGDGVTEQSVAPVAITLPGEVRSIDAGYEQSCVVVADGTALCWGAGFASLGDGGDSIRLRQIKTPAPVKTALKFVAISAGTTQTCAIAESDAAYCWGSGYGSLGVGAADTSCTLSPSCLFAPSPRLVVGGLAWKTISAGNAFTCGITKTDRAYCWGEIRNTGDPNPTYGLLGNGTFDGSKEPVPVSGGLPFRQITTGVRHACALTLEGEAWCWGNNTSAELGIGSQGGRFNTPQRVVGGLRFVSIAAGNGTCAVSINRNLYCWGQTIVRLVPPSVPTRLAP